MCRTNNPDRGIPSPRAGPVIRPLVTARQLRSRHDVAWIGYPVRKQNAIQVIEFVLEQVRPPVLETPVGRFRIAVKTLNRYGSRPANVGFESWD